MRRQRIRLLLVLLATLLDSAMVQAQSGAQCRKRILVFLDVSGSMLPTSKSADSPFQQSVAALEGLLREKDFIEEGDVVEVVRFGAAVRGQKLRAQGRGEMASLIQSLRGNKEVDRATDFRAFFSALTEALKRSDSFNAQVVLLGSDLVHEPTNGMPARAAVDDWTAALGDIEQARGEILLRSEKTAYVLFTPAPAAAYRSVQERVLEDLQQALPRSRRLSAADANEEGLAGALLRGLLSAPNLTIGRDGEDRNQLAWVISNPNCAPLHLTDVTVQRVSADGTAEEPVSFKVPSEQALLGGAGTEAGKRIVRQPIPPGPEWEKANRLRATVDTREGITGRSDGTAGSWMKADPTLAVVERYLIGSPVLRLDFRAQGLTVEPAKHRITVRQGESDESPALAEATIGSPKDLDPQRSKTYRVVMSAERQLHRLLAADRDAKFWIKVQNAPRLDGPDEPVSVSEDPIANRSNLFLIFAGLFALAAVGIACLFVSRLVAKHPVLGRERNYPVWWLSLAALSTLPLLANIFHLRLLRLVSPATLDWVAVGSAVVALFASIGFGWRFCQATSFAAQVLTARPPLTPKKYSSKSQLGAWLPWAVASAVVVGVCCLFFVWRKPVSEGLARNVTPSPLEVVADE